MTIYIDSLHGSERMTDSVSPSIKLADVLLDTTSVSWGVVQGWGGYNALALPCGIVNSTTRNWHQNHNSIRKTKCSIDTAMIYRLGVTRHQTTVQ